MRVPEISVEIKSRDREIKSPISYVANGSFYESSTRFFRTQLCQISPLSIIRGVVSSDRREISINLRVKIILDTKNLNVGGCSRARKSVLLANRSGRLEFPTFDTVVTLTRITVPAVRVYICWVTTAFNLNFRGSVFQGAPADEQ